jgi:hypothetical protein
MNNYSSVFTLLNHQTAGCFPGLATTGGFALRTLCRAAVQ